MKALRMARLLARRMEEEGERAGGALTVGDLLGRYVPYEVARGSLELTTKAEYDLLVLEFLADPRLAVLRDPAVAEAASEELETPEPGLEPLEEHGDVLLRLDLATLSGGYRGDRSDRGAFEIVEEEGGPAGPGPAPPPGDVSAETEPPSPGAESAPSGAGGGGEPDAGAGWDPTGGVEARPGPEPGEPGTSSDSAAEADAPTPTSPDSAGPAPEAPGSPRECPGCGGELPRGGDVPVRFCPHCGAERPERACGGCGAPLRPGWSYCVACGAEAGTS